MTERGGVERADKATYYRSDTCQLNRNKLDLAFNMCTTMSDFMDNVVKQLEKKQIDKKATHHEKERTKKKITTFFHRMSVITAGEQQDDKQQYKNDGEPSDKEQNKAKDGEIPTKDETTADQKGTKGEAIKHSEKTPKVIASKRVTSNKGLN